MPKINMRYKSLLIAALAFASYVATLSRHFTASSIEFASEIGSNDWLVMLQRHKMLVHPSGWVFWQLWRLAGWNGKNLLPLQVFNALFGAISVGLIFKIGYQVTRSTKIALLITLGFAVSCAAWLYSTEAEFVTMPLAETLILLWWLLSASVGYSARPAFALQLGLWTSLSILTFATNAFLVPVVIASFLLTEGQTRQCRLRQILIYLAVVGFIVLAIYAVVMYSIYDIRDWQSLRSWQVYGGEGTGTLYGRFEPSNLAYGGYAFLRTLSGYPGLGLDGRTAFFLAQAGWSQRVIFAGYYIFVLIAMVAPLATAFIKRRELLQFSRRAIGIMATWALLCAAFATYWVPKDLKFWFPVLVPWWLLVGMVLVILNAESPHSTLVRQGAPWRRIAPNMVAAMVIGVVLVVNGAGIILPHLSLERNQAYTAAMEIREHTQPQDLIITNGENWYIPYFAERRTIFVLARLLEASSKDQAFAAIDQDIARVQGSGGHVFLVNAQPSQDVAWDALAALGVTPDDLQRFRTIPAWTLEGGIAMSEILP